MYLYFLRARRRRQGCPFRDWVWLPKIGKYHFHATTANDKKFSGPSGVSNQTDKLLSQINGDLGKLILDNETMIDDKL